MRGQRHAPAAPYPRERPGTHCTGGWVGLRAGVDWCGKSRPTGIRSPDSPARRQSLYRLSYPAHVQNCNHIIRVFVPVNLAAQSDCDVINISRMYLLLIVGLKYPYRCALASFMNRYFSVLQSGVCSIGLNSTGPDCSPMHLVGPNVSLSKPVII